jgi:MFS family permease
MMSLCSAVLFGYIADKYNTTISAFIWRLWILLAIVILYHNPRIEMLIVIGMIIGLSNNLLYAVGQKILTDHDEDHNNDGAYGQTKNMISNIWYMFMPVVWWLLEFISFDRLLQLFASLLSIVVMLGIIVTFYVLIMKRHTRNISYKSHMSMKP